MKKIKNQITYDLIMKLERAFRGQKMILTGQGGLSRKELRSLQRAQMVESRPAKMKKSGSWVMAWSKMPSIDMKKVTIR